MRRVCLGESDFGGKFEREKGEWHIVSLNFRKKGLTDADFQRIAELRTLERLDLDLVGEIRATTDGWHSLRHSMASWNVACPVG